MAFFQTKNLWVKHLADGVAALMLDRDGSTSNFLDLPMLDELDRAIDAVIQSGQYHLLLIQSGKTANFCHGPSPVQLANWTKDDFRIWAERGQAVCSKLVTMPMPCVAVIAGSCCDAGLELALACDYRVVVNGPATSLGFPELEWGMIPCWGSTQRLPHLIGLENSLSMLLAGARLDARQAWQCNLADELADDVGDAPPAFLADPVKRDWATFPQRSWRERYLESNRPGRWFLFRGADRIVRTRIPDEMPAPAEMLNALRFAYNEPNLQRGLEYERQALERIVAHPALHHLLRLLQWREQLRAPIASEKHGVRKIGIIGRGTTALSLLLHSVVSGYEVVLKTKDDTELGVALAHLVQLLQAEVRNETMTPEQYQTILKMIRGTYTWTHFDGLDLIFDTAEDRLEEKLRFYRECETQIRDSALLVAVNQRHRIEDLKRGLEHAERLIGMNLVEPWTRGGVAEIAAPAPAPPPPLREWAVALGKSCLPVPDCVGGVVMRVWLPALNEAALLLKEGVPIERIDQAMRRFGMTQGPLEWMDRLGLDEIASLVIAMQPHFAQRITFETGFARMVEKQWLGNKSELGFYRRGLRKPRPNRDAEQLWRTQNTMPALSQADLHAWIQRRLVMLTVLEAGRCLDEGLVTHADDLDCALCLTGWATHRGGPIGYARQLGGDAVTAICVRLASEFGPRFAPFAALQHFLKP